jgi:hypothetical protein
LGTPPKNLQKTNEIRPEIAKTCGSRRVRVTATKCQKVPKIVLNPARDPARFSQRRLGVRDRRPDRA